MNQDHDADRGATSVEYGILVTFVALLLVAGTTLFGQSLNDWFTALASVAP